MDRVVQCHKLAAEIEYLHSREMARTSRLRHKWEWFYDQHAATELGNLIYSRLFTPNPETKP